MTNPSGDDIFASAAIRPDGYTGAWDDSHRGVTRIEISNHVYWFTPDERFHENGNDFWIVVHYFGFTKRGAAGTKMGDGREIFTAQQAASAKNASPNIIQGWRIKYSFLSTDPSAASWASSSKMDGFV